MRETKFYQHINLFVPKFPPRGNSWVQLDPNLREWFVNNSSILSLLPYRPWQAYYDRTLIVEKMLPALQYLPLGAAKEESWWIRAKSFAKGHLAVEMAASITIGTKMPTFGPKESYPTTPPRALVITDSQPQSQMTKGRVGGQEKVWQYIATTSKQEQ